MLPESVSEADRTCPDCGYIIKQKDMMFVIDHEVWHLVCYKCSKEFIL